MHMSSGRRWACAKNYNFEIFVRMLATTKVMMRDAGIVVYEQMSEVLSLIHISEPTRPY